MKIKDVIEQTKLTDKAVRLYINNGLVAPSIDESYSGRKSIDFSVDDVERLNNIALLRKAGFSIADIKGIIESEEKAKDVLLKFIDETECNIKHEREIVSKLKNIDIDDKITMELICKSLSASVSENDVPQEDMKLTLKERIRRNFAIGFAIGGMGLSLLSFAFILVSFKIEYVHLNFEKDMLPLCFLFYGGLILIFVLSLIMLIMNYNRITVGKKSKIDILSDIIALLIVVIGILSFFSSFFGTFFISCGFCSQTTDLNDYLVLDSYVENSLGDEIKTLFPGKIPASAAKLEERTYEDSFPFTTKYYYKYSNSIDADFDIVAEWVLSNEEYEKAKNEVIGKEKYSVQKGEWKCLILIDENYNWNDEERDLWSATWNNDTYWYLFFAYNDKTNKVRYVASHAIDSYTYGPYYLSLDW